VGELVSPPRKENPVDMRNPARALALWRLPAIFGPVSAGCALIAWLRRERQMGLDELKEAITGSRFFEAEFLERLRGILERIDETSKNPNPQHRTPKGAYDVFEGLLVGAGLVEEIGGHLVLTKKGQGALGR
jgi:hypothetical protein